MIAPVPVPCFQYSQCNDVMPVTGYQTVSGCQNQCAILYLTNIFQYDITHDAANPCSCAGSDSCGTQTTNYATVILADKWTVRVLLFPPIFLM